MKWNKSEKYKVWFRINLILHYEFHQNNNILLQMKRDEMKNIGFGLGFTLSYIMDFIKTTIFCCNVLQQPWSQGCKLVSEVDMYALGQSENHKIVD